MKAKFIGKVYDRYGKYVDLEYEYKGHTYFIRNHFSFAIYFLNVASPPYIIIIT